MRIFAIDLYRRHVSPRKGFRCAHRVRHGGRSCSHYARDAAMRVGLVGLLKLMRRRFRQCGEAARALSVQTGSPGAAGPDHTHRESKKRGTRAWGCEPPEGRTCRNLDLACDALDCCFFWH